MIKFEDFNEEASYYGCVYLTVNKVNGKMYVGKLVFSRKNDWRKYYGSGVYITRALRKYGKESFERFILRLATTEQELRQFEEDEIKSRGASTSYDYYNLKDSAIGGNVWLNHPRAEERKQMLSKQMSGSGNHQFGKPKTDRMINSVKEANSKRISIEGKEYGSLTEASKALGKGITTVSFRLKSKTFPTWFYL